MGLDQEVPCFQILWATAALAMVLLNSDERLQSLHLVHSTSVAQALTMCKDFLEQNTCSNHCCALASMMQSNDLEKKYPRWSNLLHQNGSNWLCIQVQYYFHWLNYPFDFFCSYQAWETFNMNMSGQGHMMSFKLLEECQCWWLNFSSQF